MDILNWLSMVGATLLVVGLAEIGDKTQIMCMLLAAKHKPLPVLFGATAAFMVLNLLAVLFGSIVTKWLPEQVVALIVAILFIFFGVKSLLAKEEDEEGEALEEKGQHTVFVTAFLLIFVAELGDKTQLAVTGISTTVAPVAVWVGATIALFLTSALGVWAGQTLLQRIPLVLLHRISGVFFLLVAVFALYKAFS
ncbi:putative membrane protein [Beggiatoa alba B18LD]|uniref:GDT1 family protein n=1 Tax=Beggiatoa alba B18LD TaxID=395493 RepID=I3CF80_9GAMM|nr:TMEM165/GDT1 family protein [Beggiatoa alba]EIJ42273.1 putative membrane protein [Beggiatoa alba B18LD]